MPGCELLPFVRLTQQCRPTELAGQGDVGAPVARDACTEQICAVPGHGRLRAASSDDICSAGEHEGRAGSGATLGGGTYLLKIRRGAAPAGESGTNTASGQRGGGAVQGRRRPRSTKPRGLAGLRWSLEGIPTSGSPGCAGRSSWRRSSPGASRPGSMRPAVRRRAGGALGIGPAGERLADDYLTLCGGPSPDICVATCGTVAGRRPVSSMYVPTGPREGGPGSGPTLAREPPMFKTRRGAPPTGD